MTSRIRVSSSGKSTGNYALALAPRKLRPHRKSRRGCGNCKLRSVKCDESKPSCEKCAAYGVFCNYDYACPDLQLSVQGAFNIEMGQKYPCSLSQTIPSLAFPQWRQQSTQLLESNASYQLREQDLKLLSKFQTRTVLTISTDQSLHIYQNEVIKLACSHPFLMHAVLSLTLMHDRHLSATPNTKLSPVEVFHWYQSISLFSSKLSGPIQRSERDALWATAAFLGTIAFYYIEAATPEEAWPLKPKSPLDLNWLRMGTGKNEIWKITQPSRTDSVFRALVTDNLNFLPPSSTEPGIEALPSEFIKLFDLDDTSTNDDNPYRAAASSLARSLDTNCNFSIILNFLSFVNNMCSDYQRLLELKDPRALLLLAYWYAKVCRSPSWWVCRRAALECQAICMYLERYHRHENIIQGFLQFPRMLSGIPR